MSLDLEKFTTSRIQLKNASQQDEPHQHLPREGEGVQIKNHLPSDLFFI